MAKFRRFRRALAIAGLGITALVCHSARADETYRPAKLVISNRPGESIGALQWQSFDLPIRVVSKDDTRQAFVDLQGTLASTDQSLVMGHQQIPLIPNAAGTGSSFTLSVPLRGEVSILTFHTVDPYGRTQMEKVALVFPDWNRFRLPLAANKYYRRLLGSVGLGISDLHYQERIPATIDMNELGLTGKINVAYRLDPDRWELGGNAFLTLLPVAISIPSGEPAARWYGVNGRVAYHLPMDIVPNTKFWLMTGWYLWGMLVNTTAANSYGVAYLSGPQLFLNARITPAGKQASFFYVKYASISDGGLQIFSTTNREYAIGGGHEVSQPGARHPISLTLDIADAQFRGTSGSLHLFSTSVGASLGL